MKRALSAVGMFLLMFVVSAVGADSMNTLSMIHTDSIIPRDTELGPMYQTDSSNAGIRELLYRFFLDPVTEEERSMLMAGETAAMLRSLYEGSLFRMLPVDDLRVGRPSQEEELKEVPIRLFYHAGGAEESTVGSVFVIDEDGQWKIVHIELNFSSQDY